MADENDNRAKEIEDAIKRGDASRRADGEVLQRLDSIVDAVASIAKRVDSIEEDRKREKERSDRRDTELASAEPAPMASGNRVNGTPNEAELDALADASGDYDDCPKPGESDKAFADRMRAKRRADSALSVHERHRGALLGAQERADRVARAFGNQAPPAMAGESVTDYRIRLLKPFQAYSPEFKEINLDRLAHSDGKAFVGIESRIYADALARASQPIVVEGTLREMIETDRTGRQISKFYGDPSVCWNEFKGPIQRLVSINKDA